MTREITQTIEVKKPIQEVFDALITPSLIKKWWSASSVIILPQKGGTYAVAWGDDEDAPDYISVATIKEINPPHSMQLANYKYASKEGSLPFEADMPVAFSLKQVTGGTKLIVRQTGFPKDSAADDFYAGCQKGWADTLAAFREVVEKSQTAVKALKT